MPRMKMAPMSGTRTSTLPHPSRPSFAKHLAAAAPDVIRRSTLHCAACDVTWRGTPVDNCWFCNTKKSVNDKPPTVRHWQSSRSRRKPPSVRRLRH